jgi:endonuclease/exonuclease/phosphatase family metal-dependent hydrolase
MSVKIKVFTWNIGKFAEKKLNSIQTEFLKDMEPETIYVIGLQEVTNSDFDKIKTFFKIAYKDQRTVLSGEKKAGVLGLAPGDIANYGLLSIILFPLNNSPNKDSFKQQETDIKGTKGYVCVNFTFKGVNINLVNVHLPFKDEITTQESITTLLKKYKDDSSIIFGDFNSRSKYDDTCLNNNNVPSECLKPVIFKKNVDLNSEFKLQSALNVCADKDDTVTECKTLREKLVKYDYIIESEIITKSGFNELPITFLPSYKIDKETGVYSLSKDNKDGRLAGYADRIIYNKNIEAIDYKELRECRGNDHYPLTLTLTVKPNVGVAALINSANSIASAPLAAGGKRKKRKSRRKTNKRRTSKRTRRYKKL